MSADEPVQLLLSTNSLSKQYVLLTIYELYSSDVIIMQCEVVCVNPLVKRSHYGTGVIRVLQTQSMTELMDRNQEKVYTCKTGRDKVSNLIT